MMKKYGTKLLFALVAWFGVGLSQGFAADDYPSYEKVTEGFKKVQPGSGETASMYTVYTKEATGELLLELPKNYASKKYFIGTTVASGDVFAGLQVGDFYVQWREYNKRIALIEPNTSIRSGGDTESKDSVERLFTGRVLLDLPILTKSPQGGVVIDGRSFLVGNASTLFGRYGRSTNPALAKIVKDKVFPKNIELAFELPNASGNLQTLYYSISEIPEGGNYQPRVADQRIGYFTTSYADYGKYQRDDVPVNYINRWHLEKRDPSLKVSPPKEPIVFYIEHTTPVRYRRWVKQGIENWNAAFEKIGISDAIIVDYQDKATGAHMDKDPEDVRYNFVRWLNNNIGTAIGPSRVHPETGQILDADIVLTDGWIRHFRSQFDDFIPVLTMEGMGAETLAWLADNPRWDPRVRFAERNQRKQVMADIQANTAATFTPSNAHLIGQHALDGLVGRTSQLNGLCMAPEGLRMDTAMMRMLMEIGPELVLKEEPKSNQSEEIDDGVSGTWDLKLTGIPELNEVEATANLDVGSDGNVTGTVGSPQGEATIDSGKWDADAKQLALELSPPGSPGKFVVVGTVEADAISGQWTVIVEENPVLSGSFSGKRIEKKMRKAEETSEATASEDDEEEPDDEDEPKSEESTKKDEKKEDAPKKSDDALLDGMPEEFVGPLLAELVSHEVGHTLGLRHNFKASSLYSLCEINSEGIKGKKTLASSVMDYIPINLRVAAGDLQGDYTMTGVGPYDFWAIEYGYTFEKKLDKILERSSEPELQYATDEDTTGPDPLARRYDFSKNPLEFAKEQSALIERFRKQLMDEYVKKGDSWTKAREGYELTLGLQARNTSMMANWLGGAFVNRDKKGETNERLPVQVVPAEEQRAALAFVLESTFRDSAYALSPELLSRLTRDFMDGSFGGEPTWPVHDRILAMQGSALTQLMNPTTLRRVYDNEFRVPAEEDTITLPELLTKVGNEVWSELEDQAEKDYTDRAPMISSLRRNLQTEHMERLIDLVLPGDGSAANKAIKNLSVMQLTEIKGKIDKLLEKKSGAKMDSYTKAHLLESSQQMGKALDAQYVYNQSSGGGSVPQIIVLSGSEAESSQK